MGEKVESWESMIESWTNDLVSLPGRDEAICRFSAGHG